MLEKTVLVVLVGLAGSIGVGSIGTAGVRAISGVADAKSRTAERPDVGGSAAAGLTSFVTKYRRFSDFEKVAQLRKVVRETHLADNAASYTDKWDAVFKTRWNYDRKSFRSLHEGRKAMARQLEQPTRRSSPSHWPEDRLLSIEDDLDLAVALTRVKDGELLMTRDNVVDILFAQYPAFKVHEADELHPPNLPRDQAHPNYFAPYATTSTVARTAWARVVPRDLAKRLGGRFASYDEGTVADVLGVHAKSNTLVYRSEEAMDIGVSKPDQALRKLLEAARLDSIEDDVIRVRLKVDQPRKPSMGEVGDRFEKVALIDEAGLKRTEPRDGVFIVEVPVQKLRPAASSSMETVVPPAFQRKGDWYDPHELAPSYKFVPFEDRVKQLTTFIDRHGL